MTPALTKSLTRPATPGMSPKNFLRRGMRDYRTAVEIVSTQNGSRRRQIAEAYCVSVGLGAAHIADIIARAPSLAAFGAPYKVQAPADAHELPHVIVASFYLWPAIHAFDFRQHGRVRANRPSIGKGDIALAKTMDRRRKGFPGTEEE